MVAASTGGSPRVDGVSLTYAEARRPRRPVSDVDLPHRPRPDLARDVRRAARRSRFAARRPARHDVPGARRRHRPAADRQRRAGRRPGVRRRTGSRCTGCAPRNEVVVEARLPYVTDGDGMHTVHRPGRRRDATSRRYVGMDIAQRVFACFDQPDLKAPISLTVDGPRRLDRARQRPARPATTATSGTFTTTPPISTYLFVVCAGPVALAHLGARRAAVRLARARVAGRRARPRLRRHAARSPRRCFDHYTRAFDEPYPFDSYDQVFGPGHNWGAHGDRRAA